MPLLVAGVSLVALAPGARGTTAGTTSPPAFHCALDASCPEVMVAGDPHATLGGEPAPFRGYGDPSLERDPSSGTIWLSYSWLDLLVSDPGPPAVADLGVRTHLARSDDGGATFTFVRAVNATEVISHPDSGAQGWTIHEVSSLVQESDGSWQDLWLAYFDPIGEPAGAEDRRDFYFARSVAGSPGMLGESSQAWARGYATSASFGAEYDLSQIPQLSDCAAMTEPALLAAAGATYLAANCVVIVDGVRRDDLERLVLLKQEAAGYSYVGALLSHADALDLGASRIEQADLAFSRTGAVLLIATPIQNATPEHMGCVVFEVTDLGSARVRRDAGGRAVALARITGEDESFGPGLCTYDASSDTGVLMVLHVFDPDPFDLEFSLRATGVHPDVAAAAGAAARVADLAVRGDGARIDGGVAAALVLGAIIGLVAVAWRVRRVRAR